MIESVDYRHHQILRQAIGVHFFKFFVGVFL